MHNWKSILIVDNEEDLVQSISEFLTLNGYKTHTAFSGEQAIEKLVSCSPDLIICDVNMSGMSGYEVLKAVKGIKKFEAIPFIFLSGMVSEQDRRKGMINGAEDYICKPFKYDQLIASIDSALKKKQKQQRIIKKLSGELKDKLQQQEQLNYLNNHEVRASLSKILQTIDLIKFGDLEIPKGLLIIYEAASRIETITVDINSILQEDHSFSHSLRLLNTNDLENIVIIDDDPVQLMLNKLILNKKYSPKRIQSFSDGRLALNSLKNGPVDVVFLDLNMPNISGLEVLEKMKEKGIEVPVVILSSSMDVTQINDCFGFENVMNYLVKPLSQQKLEEI